MRKIKKKNKSVKRAKKIRRVKKKKVYRAKAPRKERNHYILNDEFEFFTELRELVLKSDPSEKGKLVEKISKIGRVRLAVISGLFVSKKDEVSSYDAPADLFVVADDINRKRLRSFLSTLEAEVGREIKFTLMDKEEFQYRYGMFDRFVRVLLEGPHEKIINKLGL